MRLNWQTRTVEITARIAARDEVLAELARNELIPEYASDDGLFFGFVGGLAVYLGEEYAEVSLIRGAPNVLFREMALTCRVLLQMTAAVESVHLDMACAIERPDENGKLADCFASLLPSAFVTAILPDVHASAEGAVLMVHDQQHETIEIRTRPVIRGGLAITTLRVALHQDVLEQNFQKALSATALRKAAARTRTTTERVLEWCDR